MRLCYCLSQEGQRFTNYFLSFLQVEHHFYIPRLSQNWIIGTRLVKGTDMNKTLKEFGIRGSGLGGGVNVFMYVMHTKKAQVPNEAAKVRQQFVQNRQQQQQELMQQSTQVVLIVSCHTLSLSLSLSLPSLSA